MGKGKKSKDKAKSAITERAANGLPDLSNVSSAAHIAADGRNVEGWSSADINTYNELLLERAKLEKEKTNLENKAQRRSTEKALLNQSSANFDSLFAEQPGGDFKYTGRNACCLDMTVDGSCLAGSNPQAVRCKHEICSRARKPGISWMEMDTIKYYELRIFTEKSERMKNALRKQREVELIRVKKVEEEAYATKTRKMTLLDRADREALRKSSEASAKTAPGSSASEYQRHAVLEAAKQNDSELSQIRDELEDIRRQVDAGKVTSGDLRSKLDLAQRKMVEAERRNNLFRQMIAEVETVKTKVDAAVATHESLDEDLKKLCATAESAVAQAMTLMKDFFSASGPDQMKETMSRLKSTLEARGPIPKNMKESFKELEAMVAESKAKGLKMDFKVDYSGAVTGNSMFDTMTALRVKMKEGPNSQTNPGPELELDDELIQANQGCLRVEEVAETDMSKEAHRLSSKSSDALLQALTKIKDDAVAKSPIPPLSDIMLESKLQGFMDVHSAGLLVRKVEKGASDQEVAGRITSLVLTKAQNSPDKFLMAFSTVATSFDIATRSKLPEQIRSQLYKVEKSMQAWVEKHALKQSINGLRNDQVSKLTQSLTDTRNKHLKTESLTPPQQLAKDQSQLLQSLGKFPDLGKTLQNPNATGKSLNGLVRTFLQKHPEYFGWILDTLAQKIKGQLRTHAQIMEFLEVSRSDAEYQVNEPLALLDYVSALYKAGYCARLTCSLASHALFELVTSSPEKVNTDLRLLQGLLSRTESSAFKSAWFRGFRTVAAILLSLHTSLNHEFELKTLEEKTNTQHRTSLVFYAFFFCVLNPVIDSARHVVNVEYTVGLFRGLVASYGITSSEVVERSMRELEVVSQNTPFQCTGHKCECFRPAILQPEPTSHHLLTLPRPATASSNAPNIVTTFYKLKRPGSRKQEHNPSSAKNLWDGNTTGGNALEVTIKAVKHIIQAYWAAKLDPPWDLILALKTLVGLTDGLEPSISDERWKYDSDPHVTLSKYRRMYSSSWCLRDSKSNVTTQFHSGPRNTSAFPKPNMSKFTEHIDHEEPEKKSDLSVKEKKAVLLGAKRRFMEIISGRTSPEYLSWIVLNLVQQAQTGNHSYVTEPIDDFVDLFNTVGRIPECLAHALDVAKRRLQNDSLPKPGKLDLLPTLKLIDPLSDGLLWEEISDMLKEVAVIDNAFKSEDEWQMCKLTLRQESLLTDEEYVEAFADNSTKIIQLDPSSLHIELDSLKGAYEMEGIPAGEYFNATLAEMKIMAQNRDLKAFKMKMKIICRMMMARYRLNSNPLSEKELERELKPLREYRERLKAAQDGLNTYHSKNQNRGRLHKLNGPNNRLQTAWLQFTSLLERPAAKGDSSAPVSQLNGRHPNSNGLIDRMNSFVAHIQRLEEYAENAPAPTSSGGAPIPEIEQAMQECLGKVAEFTKTVIGGAIAIVNENGWVDVQELLKD